MPKRPRSIEDWVAGIRAHDRAVVGRAITLVESGREADHDIARELVAALLPYSGHAVRVGISGAPGAGKSTLIDALGGQLIEQGHRVAVLAVDPSSAISGGSILGDKTRMQKLASDPRAFVRPSPNARSLGGVGRRTREAMLILEAAGHDVVLVETVGVGQSEAMVAEMVDFFLLLILPGSGDELQGIKRGIMELADLVAISKADGDNLTLAALARREYSAALRYLRPRTPGWSPRAIAISALTGAGLDELWAIVLEHRALLEGSGQLAALRSEQRVRWMWSAIHDRLEASFLGHPEVSARRAALEAEVRAGRRVPSDAARELLAAFGIDPTD